MQPVILFLSFLGAGAISAFPKTLAFSKKTSFLFIKSVSNFLPSNIPFIFA
jgi:hypothetical protein